MEATHTLDFSRLRVIEDARTVALGKWNKLGETSADLQKKLRHVEGQLANRKQIYKEFRENGGEIYAPDPVTGDPLTAKILKGFIDDLERKIQSIEADIGHTATATEIASQEFSQADRLYASCKKIIQEMIDAE